MLLSDIVDDEIINFQFKQGNQGSQCVCFSGILVYYVYDIGGENGHRTTVTISHEPIEVEIQNRFPLINTHSEEGIPFHFIKDIKNIYPT